MSIFSKITQTLSGFPEEQPLKIDPKKVKYDGHSFRLIITDEAALLKRLKKIQKQILKNIHNTGGPQ